MMINGSRDKYQALDSLTISGKAWSSFFFFFFFFFFCFFFSLLRLQLGCWLKLERKRKSRTKTGTPIVVGGLEAADEEELRIVC